MAVCSVAACQYIHDQWQAALHAQDQISTMVSDCTNVVSENAARLAAAQAQSTSNAAAPPSLSPSQAGPSPANTDSGAQANAAALQAAQKAWQHDLDELAKRTAERQTAWDQLQASKDKASSDALDQLKQAMDQIAQMEAGFQPGGGPDTTGTNNAPPLPTGDDFVNTAATPTASLLAAVGNALIPTASADGSPPQSNASLPPGPTNPTANGNTQSQPSVPAAYQTDNSQQTSTTYSPANQTTNGNAAPLSKFQYIYGYRQFSCQKDNANQNVRIYVETYAICLGELDPFAPIRSEDVIMFQYAKTKCDTEPVYGID
jgi:hypothetical protein